MSVSKIKFGILFSRWMDGCRYESNCPLVGPGSIGGLPSVGVFLRDPSPYLAEFRRKPRKNRTARSRSGTGD